MGNRSINNNTPQCRLNSIPDLNLKVQKKVQGRDELTIKFPRSKNPDTALVRNAQGYVNKVWEDTKSHYDFLAKLGKNNAEFYKNSAWCALAVSILAKEAGINIGADVIPTVSGFISRAGVRYKAIHTNTITSSNVKQERASRAGKILQQIQSGKMKEGDFVIWKTDKALKDGQNWQTKQASHIGIIESVNIQKGTITVIEGNANITLTDNNGEPLLVKDIAQGIRGNQSIGEVREKNLKDGLLKKTYTYEELARDGYSGFIDNAGIVK